MPILRIIVVATLFSALMSAADAVKIVCVGDSITFGDKLDKGQMTYPQNLEKLFAGKATVANAGHNGAAVQQKSDNPYWKTREFEAAKASGAAVVVIMLGTNDARQKKPAKGEQDQYGEDLKALVEVFKNLPGQPQVVLCTPPPAYSTRYGIRPDDIRDEIVPLVKDVATAEHVPVVNVYAAMSGHPEWFADGIHPNETGAVALAGIIHDALTGGDGK